MVVMETAPPKPEPGKPAQPKGATHTYSASTDLNGSFRIAGVVPGDYYVLGQQEGYLAPSDEAAAMAGSDPDLTVQATEAALNRVTVDANQTASIDLSLTRGASLSGTVQYDDGGAGIRLAYHLYRRDGKGKWQRYTNHPGDSSLAPLGLEAHTDGQGRFHERALPPGVYTADVELPGDNPDAELHPGAHELTAQFHPGDALLTMYGNKHRLAGAEPIKLREGEDRSGMDITIPINGLHSVAGTAVAKLDGRPVAEGTAKLLDPTDNTELRRCPLDGNGGFAFHYVPAGAYLLEIAPEGASGKTLSPASAPLDVEGDLVGLSYGLAPVRGARR